VCLAGVLCRAAYDVVSV